MNRTIIDSCAQNSPEWYLLRSQRVTSSCFNKVISKGRGSAPSLTRLTYLEKLAAERITGKVEDGYQSKFMQRGHEVEGQARSVFRLETGYPVREIAFVTLGDDIGASTDGLIGDDGVLEIKCPKDTTHINYLRYRKKLLRDYNTQVQGEMWVTGRDMGCLLSYHPNFPAGQDLIILDVKRDEDFIEKLQIQVEDFISDLNDFIDEVG